MTTHDDDQIARWLSVGPDGGPTAALDATLAQVPAIRQRPGWLVDLLGGTIDSRPVDRRARLSLAVAVGVLVVVAGGIFVAGSLFPSPEPSATVIPSPTAEPTPSAAATPTEGPAGEVIVFTEIRDLVNGEEDCTGRRCRKTWIAVINTDGTGQRRLFPGAPPTQTITAVSADGSVLIAAGMEEGDEPALYATFYRTDLQGSAPRPLDTQCSLPCVSDWITQFGISPDGERLAFVRTFASNGVDTDSSAIAVMELASGEVTILESTVASNPDLGPPCHSGCGEGDTADPRWSPDGRHLLFSRTRVGIPNEPRTILDTVLFVVDADGANLRQLVPTELFARDAQWSPDGQLITFTSGVETLTIDDFGKLENWHQLNDIYTVRPDGSDVRRLTSFTLGIELDAPGDVGATVPTWTRDGRIAFARRLQQLPDGDVPPWEIWTMDADGGNAAVVEPADAPALTALGCVDCWYPFPDPYDYPWFAYWRPSP